MQVSHETIAHWPLFPHTFTRGGGWGEEWGV